MGNEEEVPGKKRHGVKIAVVLVLVGILGGSGGYLKVMHDSPVFYEKTSVNGVDVSGQNVAEAAGTLAEAYRKGTITILENGEEAMTGSLEDYGYTVDSRGLEDALLLTMRIQRGSLPDLVRGIFQGADLRSRVPFTCREEVFTGKVVPQNLAAERIPSRDAYVKYKKKYKEYRVIPEVYGNEISGEDLQSLVRQVVEGSLSEGAPGSDTAVEIPEELYPLPSVTSEDYDLNNLCNVYNMYCHSKVNYQFGDETVSLTWKQTKDWLIVGNATGRFDEDRMYEFVLGLEEKYNTRHLDRLFTTSMGTQIRIPGYDNEYGYTIDEEAELNRLRKDLAGNTAVTREPVYYEANSYGNPYYYRRQGTDDLAGTYVEASLSAQHLWFYKNGALITESDFVSGSVAKNRQTKTGVFPLAYKESPSVLVGEDGNNGYRTEVKYWMPFYEGQGLHDATWRGAFGGSIYQSDGSHGCINLPYWAAETIYQNIDAGVAIVIY